MPPLMQVLAASYGRIDEKIQRTIKRPDNGFFPSTHLQIAEIPSKKNQIIFCQLKPTGTLLVEG